MGNIEHFPNRVTLRNWNIWVATGHSVYNREVGGSNPLAPTIQSQLTAPSAGGRISCVENLWTKF